MLRPILAIAMLCFAASAASAQATNPQIDYPGFEGLTQKVGTYRAARLVSWAEFAKSAKRPGALILDARSADAYAAGHIRGAVNLPFTDFTAESLKRVIGNADRPILIYCNNNFRNNVAPVMLKVPSLALNIQTFINLVGYGYPNVWELDEAIDFNDPKVRWVKAPARIARAN
jgi:phage shock protein E